MKGGRRQAAIAGLIVALVTVVFFMFLLRPKMQEISDAQEDLERARDQHALLLSDLRRLQTVRKDAPRTRAQLARAGDLLPSTPELPSFIRLVQNAATLEGVELISIAPSPPGDFDTGVRQIPVSILIEGSFFRTEGFLARLENLDRLLQVTSLSMTPRQDNLSGQTILTTTLGTRMFLVEELT